jgi:hypothetical protein
MHSDVCDKIRDLNAHQKTVSFDELDEAFAMADFERTDPPEYPNDAVYTHPALGNRQWTVTHGDDQLSPGEVASAIEAIEEVTAHECGP